MAEIEYVKKIDNKIKLNTILVSCTNKEGLVSNKRKDGTEIEDLPKEGILGIMAKLNPEIQFISTGGTFKIIKEAGLNVMEVSELTGYPEMKTGLVKSLHPAVHAGLLAHNHTQSDDEFMKQQGLKYIDALIVNFYPLDETKESTDNFEIIRQNIDVGGPSMSHNARKAFISTALIVEPKTYTKLAHELEDNYGSLMLKTRLELAKIASEMITAYMMSVDNVIQDLEYEDLENTYEIINEE